MAELHGHLSRKRDLDLEGRAHQVWARRALLALFVALVAAALLNAFGQRSTTTTAATTAASLSVSAPDHLRGGLIFEGRLEIHANASIRKPRLVLDRGWVEGMTLNSLGPSPSFETTHDGRLEIGYPPIAAGSELTVYTQWQVNPVNVGSRSQDVSLYDGHRLLATANRNVTVFP